MPAKQIASNVNGIGTPSRDGVFSSIRVGTYPNDWTEKLQWNAAEQKWIGLKEYTLIDQVDADPMAPVFHSPASEFSYLGGAFTLPTYSWGYRINWHRPAAALAAAGLTLQERVSARIGQPSSGVAPELVVFYYQWDVGNHVNYGIPPDSVSDPTHLGYGNVYQCPAPVGGNMGISELQGGWLDTGLVPTKDALYPDFYMRVPGAVNSQYAPALAMTLKVRWVWAP